MSRNCLLFLRLHQGRKLEESDMNRYCHVDHVDVGTHSCDFSVEGLLSTFPTASKASSSSEKFGIDASLRTRTPLFILSPPSKHPTIIFSVWFENLTIWGIAT
jgi:hypothetical protein